MTQLHSVASLDYGDGRTCVCRICECGKHRCPGLKIPFIGETTYRNEYVPKEADHDQGGRKKQVLHSTKAEPGHFKTTKQEAAELIEGKHIHPAESYKPRHEARENLPFDANTTNRTDYPGYMPEYRRTKPKQEPMPSLQGIYDTTKGAMDDPIKKLSANSKLPKPPKSFKSESTAQPDLPFDGVSSYMVDYPAKEAPPARSANMNKGFVPVPENRDFQTISSETYVIPPTCLQRKCPAAFVSGRPVSQDGHIKLSVYNIPSGIVS
ncbi:unnamed protein product [Phytomonas sp. Hart1]|nr:unnamed protein product [Phytomonas sp. Hart1]|eukprot:CCW65932.1 unnamed protein product [Phytomonas sp. isolate Hart1]